MRVVDSRPADPGRRLRGDCDRCDLHHECIGLESTLIWATAHDEFDGTELFEPGEDKYADPVVVDGGDGKDTIRSISAYSCPDGEDGDDVIDLVDYVGSIAGHGSCVVFGGAGNDRMIGSDRADFIEAGPGTGQASTGKGGGDGLDGGRRLDDRRGRSRCGRARAWPGGRRCIRRR